MQTSPPPAVLVVDDDLGLLRLMERTLGREGYEVATAASGEAAFHWLEEHRPALMLLDLKLDDLDGRELIERLAAAGRSVPFVIITGQGDERVAVEMMKSGALDYLVKDVAFQELLPSVVKRALDQVERERKLAEAEAGRQRLEGEILEISNREQRRIGHDLHDGLCQHLAGIELMSQVLTQTLEKQSNPEATQAATIAAHVREAIAQTRRLARGLSPVELEADGLRAALQELADNTQNMFRVQCTFTCPEKALLRDNTVSTHLYRIAQEAITNAIKHGRARTLALNLSVIDGRVRLTIADDGSGIPEPLLPGAGMGLRIMKYRAETIGAGLEVRRGKEGGTVVECELEGSP